MFITFRPGIDFQGLNPVVTVTHAQTGNILASNIPMIENTPGNYSSVISIAPENDVVIPPPPGINIPPQSITRTPPVEVLVDAGITVEINKRYASATNVLHPHEAILNQIRQEPIIDNVGTPSQVSRCPYCFSHLNGEEEGTAILIWDDDPTKVKGTQVMSIYKGFMQIKKKHIVDIQDNRKDIESNLDISPLTEFTSLNDSGMFQITKNHVKELRDSTEKILEEMTVEKDTYFNYDEEGTERREEHQKDWTDVNIDTSIFQTKAFHIEDLRHYLGNDYLCTFFDEFYGGILGPTYGQYMHILKTDLTLSKSIFFGTFRPVGLQTAQGKYILTYNRSPDDCTEFRDKNTLNVHHQWNYRIESKIFFDKNYAWSFTHTPSWTQSYVVYRDPQSIKKYDVITGNTIETISVQLDDAGGLSGDKDFLYGFCDNAKYQTDGETYWLFTDTLISKIWKYNKTTSEIITKEFNSTEVIKYSDYPSYNSLVNDSEFLYLLFSTNYQESRALKQATWYLKKFRKTDLELIDSILLFSATEGGGVFINPPKITIDSNNIYVLCNDALRKYNKNLELLSSNSNYHCVWGVGLTETHNISHTAEYGALLKDAPIVP